MKKTEFHSLLVSQVKIIYCLLAAFGLSIIAALDIYQGELRFAAIAAGFALGLVLYATYLLLIRQRQQPAPYIEWALVLLLLFFTLFGMHQNPQVVHWVYFVPIYVFFLLPFVWANVALVVYSLVLTLLIWQQFTQDMRLIVLTTFFSCYLFSLMYALINDRNTRRLLTLTNTDPLTQAFNENQLIADLNKEITRAERQHSSLLLMLLSPPQSWDDQKLEALEQNLGRLGYALRKTLRKYDSFYRLENNRFVVLIPHGKVENVIELQQGLQPHLTRLFGLDSSFRMRVMAFKSGDDSLGLLRRLQGK